MANIFTPNGFWQIIGTGATPTYEQVEKPIAQANTTPIFYGDPVMQAASATGVGTGYLTQAYGPVTLTVAATAVTTNSTGSLVVTYTAATSTSGNLPSSPNAWAPPIGSTIVIVGSTTASGVNLNGTYTVTASTTTTVTASGNGPQTPSITSTASGTVQVFVPVAGVFVGCKYLSVSQKRTTWGQYWPGSDANGDVTGYIITDPNAQFAVMTGNSNTTATPVGLANIGQNISFHYQNYNTAATNGNTGNGLSTFFADQYSLIANSVLGPPANALLPFRITGLANYVPGQVSPLASINGNDSTTAYNRIIVGFNNSMQRGLAGI